MSIIADNLKALRKSAGMTQADLAEKLYTAPQSVSRWENGEGEPSIDMLIGIARVFDISTDTLVSSEGVPGNCLYTEIVKYIEKQAKDELPKSITNINRSILKGFSKRLFPDVTDKIHPTYSDFGTGGIYCLYADREDTPDMFLTYKSAMKSEFDDVSCLMPILAALSDANVYTVLSSTKIHTDIGYDGESLCKFTGIDENNLQNTIFNMKLLDCVRAENIFVNGEGVTLYFIAARKKLKAVISLIRLSFLCGTDGNLSF